jgi:hypothetical protein
MVTERVDELAVALAPECVMQRLEGHCASLDRAVPAPKFSRAIT